MRRSPKRRDKYGYDAAGNNTLIYDRDGRLDLIYDSASRLAVLRSVAEDARTHLLYDGRGFLRQAAAGADECRPGATLPTYDSEGLLHRREHRSLFTPAAPPAETDTIFYFAGRPVATLRLAPGSSTLTYLTTDHLGTPILATADTGALIWQGGFEPFGENWNGASGAGVFLRFPGQWVDPAWESGRLASGLYQNVYRWYVTGTGRYISEDLLQWQGGPSTYAYAAQNPLRFYDPLGLAPVKNNADRPIPYKPENQDDILLCLPGSTCDADGVYPPSCQDFPIKVVTGCTGEVNTNGKLVVRCPFFNLGAEGLRRKLPWLGQALIGGPTDEQFHKDHPDWPIPNREPSCGCEMPPAPKVL